MSSASDPSAVRDLESSAPPAGPVARLPNSAPTGWLSFFVPSTVDLIFVLLLVSLSAGPLGQKMLGDAGIGWHIRTGELILHTGSVPHSDPFSSTMSGKPWYAWEWLYDLIVGGLHRETGLNGVVFFDALIIAVTFALVFRQMLARGSGLGVAVGMLLLVVSASSIHFLARPHVLSWLFTVIFFDVLAAFENDGNPRRLMWLPAIMLLWANLHGGFLLGLVLVGIHFLAEWAGSTGWGARGDRELAARKAKQLALAGAITGAVTLANPYGYQLHLHIYRYLGDRFLMDHIDEFLSPNFHGLPQKCFAGILLLVIVGAATTPKRLRASQVMVILFAVYSGLFASRNIPISSMLLALVMAPHLSASITERWRPWMERVTGFWTRVEAMESGLRGHLWPTLAVLLGIWVCAQHGRLGSMQLMDAHFDAKRFPANAVDWLARTGVSEPVFCPDYWGGYLIYRRFPEMPVVVDDRHDLYGAEYLKNYLKLMRVEPGWESALEQMHTNWILLPYGSTAATLLREVPRWKVAYQDETSTIFTRASKQ